jgi:phosphoribosyl-ATP pyrophosphohydrolase
MSGSNLAFLEELEQVIEQRKAAAPDSSYTARLYNAGRSRIAQKLGEEAVELVVASVQADRQRIVAEAADLLYHLLVLLRSHDLKLADVAVELSHRQR